MTTQTLPTFSWSDYRLAREYGWTSYRPGHETREQGAVRSALSYARRMAAMDADPDIAFGWEDSIFPWDGCEPYDGPLYDATLYVNGEPAESLCCIAIPSLSDPYVRVVEADLYGGLEDRRESMIVRGES